MTVDQPDDAVSQAMRLRASDADRERVAGILRDKDIEGIAARLDGRGEWIAVGLEGDRALAVNELARRLAAQPYPSRADSSPR